MLVVLIGTMLFGAIKGFAWQLASITSIILSYVVAYNFREPLSESIQADPPWNRFLAMLILYVGTSLLIWVAFRMVSQTIDRFRLKEFDRQVGALFGLAKGALYCTLITLFAVTLLGETSREIVVQSKSGRYIAQVLDRSEAIIPEEIGQVIGPYLERFDDRLKPSIGERFLPWANQSIENQNLNSFSAPFSGNQITPTRSDSTPEINPWFNGSNRPPSGPSLPVFRQSSSAPSEAFSNPIQQAERPWSSVYSPANNR